MVEVVGWLGQSAGSDEEIAMLIGQDKSAIPHFRNAIRDTDIRCAAPRSMMAPVRTKPTQYNDGEWWKNLQDEKTQEEWEKAIDDPSHPFHDEIVACKNVPLTQDQRAFRYDIRRRIRKTLVHPRFCFQYPYALASLCPALTLCIVQERGAAENLPSRSRGGGRDLLSDVAREEP
eukprot:2945098-Rhodomonas_salina.1